MSWLIFIVVCFAMYLSVCVRVVVLNPVRSAIYACTDVYSYFRYCRWRLLRTGEIRCYVGLFGKGKTLSAVHYVLDNFNRYNNKKVYDPDRKKWVTQRVHVISNVELSIPHERFVSLSQLVSVADTMRRYDIENDTLTITLVLGDEFSVQLNSRSFKTNIDPLFLNTLLTCRHHHISLVYTSQRFNHVDALLRQVTSSVITCNKCWRVMVHASYDAYELENASDPTMVAPLSRYGWFIRNADFAAYDTLACVGNLAKSCREGDMLTEAEILSLQCNTPDNMENVKNPSRHYIRMSRKRRK